MTHGTLMPSIQAFGGFEASVCGQEAIGLDDYLFTSRCPD